MCCIRHDWCQCHLLSHHRSAALFLDWGIDHFGRVTVVEEMAHMDQCECSQTRMNDQAHLVRRLYGDACRPAFFEVSNLTICKSAYAVASPLISHLGHFPSRFSLPEIQCQARWRFPLRMYLFYSCRFPTPIRMLPPAAYHPSAFPPPLQVHTTHQ